MAIAQPIVQMIKRSEGRSATAAAAYRAGERIEDKRLEETFDYRRKSDVVSTEILAPAGAPDWVFNRSELWNNAEAAERQWNGQPAREIILILPRELSDHERVTLVREFAQKHWVDNGMIADICHHKPDAGDGGSNPHAHVLLTMRRLDGDQFAKTKERQWNRDFVDGQQSTNPKQGGFFNKKKSGPIGWVGQHKNGFMGFRQEWQNAVNAALEDSGSEARVDLRSYKKQGLDIEPQQKIGIHAKDRRGRKILERQTANDDITDRNEARQYFKPQHINRRRQAAAAGASRNMALDEFMAFYDTEKNHELNDIQGRGGHER